MVNQTAILTPNMSANKRRRRGIFWTVFSLMAVMTLFLSLFFHKITTARLLSPVESHINGLVLRPEVMHLPPIAIMTSTHTATTTTNLEGRWRLLFLGGDHCGVACDAYYQNIKVFLDGLKESVRNQTSIIIALSDTDTIKANTVFEQSKTRFANNFEGLLIYSKDKNSIINILEIPHANNNLGEPDRIAIVNPEGRYHGYFKAPFEHNKMVLTYSSAVTHFSP